EDPTTDDGEVGGTLIDPEDYVTTVALNCGEEGVALNSDTVTDFYLILPPQTFESGITVKVTCADGTVVEKSTTSPLTISRNAIQPMTALTINGKPTEPATNEIWYTATEKVVKDNWTVDTFGANITDHTFDTTTGKGVITFDGEVTKIGTQAFYECRSLTSITIPDSVTSIGEQTFYYCSGLTNIAIGNGVTEIGNGAFWGCGLTDVIIPNSVTEIGNVAFISCAGLTSITIPDSVTSIGDYAFHLCSGLTSVTIGNGVTEIGYGAFSHCYDLTNVTIPDSVTKIGEETFGSCPITEFNGKFATSDKKAIIVDNTLVAYAIGCTDTEYTIPDGVTRIGNCAFLNCSGLTNITIPDNVTEIGENAFGYCDGLTSVTIPDGVTEIGEGTFCYCSGLTSVTIPDSVTEIGSSAFSDCNGLTSVFCKPTTPPTLGQSIPWDAFDDNATNRKIYVPAESVDAYKEADGWKEYADAIVADPATLPATNEIWYTATEKVVKDNWTVDTFGANITDHTFDTTTGKGIITFDGEVTKIGTNAFYECDSLTSVTIPDSVTEIGHDAFISCDGLTNITIPDSVTSIGDYAFHLCSGLTNIAIGNGVTSIGVRVFYHCSGLTSITIPDSVTKIGYQAFEYCPGLTSVTIGNGVTEIESYAFGKCYDLTSVFCKPTTPPTLGQSIPWDAFENNASDHKIYVPTESVNAYKVADGWKEYADAIEPYNF
ncbi:MAG: leucine-rich repeat domain-containing protein, partial [Alistipes sp.]|nr:leucine-rich repeat domain-containing protein [Alistipes sp.]